MKINMILLAAGLGSRLGSITDDTPKSMVKISKADTILDRLLEMITIYQNDNNIKISTTVVIGHLGDQVLDGISSYDCHIVDIGRELKYSNAYTMYKGLQDQFSRSEGGVTISIDTDTVFLTYEIFETAINSVLRNYKSGYSSIVTTEKRSEAGDWVVRSSEDSIVTEIACSSEEDGDILTAGVVALTESDLSICYDQLKVNYDTLDYWDRTYEALVNDRESQFKSVFVPGILEVDKVTDLENVRYQLNTIQEEKLVKETEVF